MDLILREADVMCVALRPANVGVLTRVQSALKAQGVSAEWTPRERLHCTLLTSDIPDDATAKAILRGLGLPLVFSTEGVRLEAWGDYLVLVLDPRPALPRIQTDIFNRAEALGLQVSSYAPPGVYRPHVTLGTFPRGSLDGLDGFPTDPLWFDEVVVWNGDYRQVDAARLPKEAGDRLFVEVSGVTRRLVARGGPGSGHFGHEGRPGKQGGSLPGNVRVERLPGEDIARANPDGSISVDPDKFFGHSPEMQAEILAHEQAHFLEAKIPPEVKATLFDDGVVSAYRGKNVNEQLANMIEDGKLPAYLQAYIDQPGDFHSAEGGPVAGKPGATIEGLRSADLTGTGLDAVYNGLKAYLADFYPGFTETDSAQRVFESTKQNGDSSWWLMPNGVWIGGYGLDHERSAKTTMRNAVGNEPTILRGLPQALRDQFDDNGNAKVQVFNIDETAAMSVMHDAGYLRVNLAFVVLREETVGDILGRRRATTAQFRALESLVAILPNPQFVVDIPVFRHPPVGALGLNKLFPAKLVDRSESDRPPKRERKDTGDWRTGKDLPDDIVDRAHLYLSVDLPEQFIVQDVENPTDWKPEISNPLDGDKDRLVRWLGYNIRAYHSPDGWDMREAGERAGVINRIPTPIMRERIDFLDGMGASLERATLGPEMVALSEAVTAAFGGEPIPRWALVQGDPDETIEVLAKGKTVSGVIGQMTLSDWTALDNDSKRRLLGEFYMEDAGLETGGMGTMLPEVVRVLYYDTQDILQAQGFEKDSKVRLYRGLVETPDILLPAEMDGGWVNVEISNLSPWSFSPGVAAEYATEQVGQGSILAMDVPVSMIFCNWETGPASRRWLSYLLMASREPMKAYLYPVQRARLRHG